MNLSNLKPAKGSVKKNKRLGRGTGSGRGGTSTRGHKGAQSRSGYSAKAGFEGGQMPLQRRVPKGGFKNPFRVEYIGINLDKLQELIDTYNMESVDVATLHANGIVKKSDKVKILGRGELKSKIAIKVHAYTGTAKAAIEKLGGTAETI
jgi:large subunit ribosomal protein L15